jgi:SAM-dependent methyltransferase
VSRPARGADPAGRADHWQGVYRTKPSDSLSWYRPHLDASLELIAATGAGSRARILDVGSGASTLVDDLLAAGYEDVSVLDVAGEALDLARRRLGAAAQRVSWIEADITRVDLQPGSVDVWHDRATLHFLIDEDDRRRYARTLRQALAPDGHLILATFAPGGPPQCSDLPVRQHQAADLQALVGSGFTLRRACTEVHKTPSGSRQPFTYCWLQRGGGGLTGDDTA